MVLQGNVLLLNASYEPLRLIPITRALVLVIEQKAEVVQEGTGFVRSPSTQFPVPAVVRLLRYVKVPYRRRAALNLRNLLARDNNKCQYCGGKAESIDHVIPRAKGGKHEWENVVAACTPCNGKKADKLLSDLGWKLPRKPRAPKDTIWLILGVGQIQPEWEEFVAPFSSIGEPEEELVFA